MMPTHVLLVDDDQAFRHFVKRQLAKDQALRVVGEAGDGSEALRLTRTHPPDVILMDLAMPKVSGLEATRHIKAEHPDIRVIILTQYQEEAYRQAAAQSGADAFLTKKTRMADLLATIRAVAGERPGGLSP